MYTAWLRPFQRVETLLAPVFGVLFATALHAYFLSDYFPITGRRLPLLTFVAFAAGSVGFYFLFRALHSWIGSLTAKKIILLAATSLVLSVFLFYTSSNAWSDEFRYPSFLLPAHSVKIEATSRVPGLAVQWLSTSLGDISYQAARLQGWQRNGDELQLVDPADNWIEWQGKTGDELKIVFQRPSEEATVELTIDGRSEAIVLAASGDGPTNIVRSLHVPFYSSRAAAKTSLILTLAALFFALLTYLACNEREIARRFQSETALLPSGRSENWRGAILSFQRWEWLAIFLFFAAAILLRIFRLGELYPYPDEYLHLINAKRILNGAPVFSLYQRSMFMVTLPVALSFKAFGVSIWAGRLPGVIVNSLAVLPLYLAARKINRPTALLAVFLYATNPWIIAVARNVREYAYYPFYFFWVLYAMLLVLERLPDRLALGRSFLKQIHRGWLVPMLLLALPIIYGLEIDNLSTFKILLIAYGVFALFILAKFDPRARANYLPVAVLLVAAVLVGMSFIARQRNFISLELRVFAVPLQLFFPNPVQQWFYDRLNLIPLLAIFCAAAFGIWQYRHNPAPLFFATLLGAFLVFFVFFFARYYRPRYIFSVELWYTLVVAFGLYALWVLLSTFLPRKIYAAGIACLALAASFNSAQVLLPTTYDAGGFMPISVEYHYNLDTVDQYIREAMQPGDALVATIYNNYVSFTGNPKFRAVKAYDSANPKAVDTLLPIMKQYPTGWLVVDWHRYLYSEQHLPLKTFDLGGFRLEYIGQFYDEYMWRWHPVSGG